MSSFNWAVRSWLWIEPPSFHLKARVLTLNWNPTSPSIESTLMYAFADDLGIYYMIQYSPAHVPSLSMPDVRFPWCLMAKTFVFIPIFDWKCVHFKRKCALSDDGEKQGEWENRQHWLSREPVNRNCLSTERLPDSTDCLCLLNFNWRLWKFKALVNGVNVMSRNFVP